MKLLAIAILWLNVAIGFINTLQWYIPSNSTFDMTIFTPTERGTYPVIVFLTGFAGVVPALSYSKLLTKIADQKIIVVGVSKNQTVLAEFVEQKFVEFMDIFTDPRKGLRGMFKNNRITKEVKPDLENQLVFVSHSAGCHVLTLYLVNRCGQRNINVKLFIMISPVDGRSPFDFSGVGKSINYGKEISTEKDDWF